MITRLKRINTTAAGTVEAYVELINAKNELRLHGINCPPGCDMDERFAALNRSLEEDLDALPLSEDEWQFCRNQGLAVWTPAVVAAWQASTAAREAELEAAAIAQALP